MVKTTDQYVKQTDGSWKHAPSRYEQTGNARKPPIEYGAKAGNLVDIVDNDGTPNFLLLEDGELSLRSTIVQESHPRSVPPKSRLPFLLPRAHEVDFYFKNDTDSTLYSDTVKYLRDAAELPGQDYYILAALWILGTWLLEFCHYFPYLTFYAVPERGKSRIARAIAYISYRGLVTETLNEANLFRWSEHLGATIAFDVRDLWSKAERKGSDDLLLNRYERGSRVARVLYPERGAFKDTVYYDTFGATLLAVNNQPQEPLLSRCLVVGMPLSARRFPNNITPEAGLPLKERLAAFRARHLEVGLPEHDKPLFGRMGDILQPLARVARLLRNEDEFQQAIRPLYKQCMEDRSTSQDARLVQAVEQVSKHMSPGETVSTESITEGFDGGIPEDKRWGERSIGKRLRAIGFQSANSRHPRGIVHDPTLLASLKEQYGLSEPESVIPDAPSQQTPKRSSSFETDRSVSGSVSDKTLRKRSDLPHVGGERESVLGVTPESLMGVSLHGQLEAKDIRDEEEGEV